MGAFAGTQRRNVHVTSKFQIVLRPPTNCLFDTYFSSINNRIRPPEQHYLSTSGCVPSPRSRAPASALPCTLRRTNRLSTSSSTSVVRQAQPPRNLRHFKEEIERASETAEVLLAMQAGATCRRLEDQLAPSTSRQLIDACVFEALTDQGIHSHRAEELVRLLARPLGTAAELCGPRCSDLARQEAKRLYVQITAFVRLVLRRINIAVDFTSDPMLLLDGRAAAAEQVYIRLVARIGEHSARAVCKRCPRVLTGAVVEVDHSLEGLLHLLHNNTPRLQRLLEACPRWIQDGPDALAELLVLLEDIGISEPLAWIFDELDASLLQQTNLLAPRIRLLKRLEFSESHIQGLVRELPSFLLSAEPRWRPRVDFVADELRSRREDWNGKMPSDRAVISAFRFLAPRDLDRTRTRVEFMRAELGLSWIDRPQALLAHPETLYINYCLVRDFIAVKSSRLAVERGEDDVILRVSPASITKSRNQLLQSAIHRSKQAPEVIVAAYARYRAEFVSKIPLYWGEREGEGAAALEARRGRRRSPAE